MVATNIPFGLTGQKPQLRIQVIDASGRGITLIVTEKLNPVYAPESSGIGRKAYIVFRKVTDEPVNPERAFIGCDSGLTYPVHVVEVICP